MITKKKVNRKVKERLDAVLEQYKSRLDYLDSSIEKKKHLFKRFTLKLEVDQMDFNILFDSLVRAKRHFKEMPEDVELSYDRLYHDFMELAKSMHRVSEEARQESELFN